MHQLIRKRVQLNCVNGDSIRTPSINPSASTIITFPVISVGKTKATCIICRKESKDLRSIPRSTRADIFIQQGVLVPDGPGSSVVFYDSKFRSGMPIYCIVQKR